LTTRGPGITLVAHDGHFARKRHMTPIGTTSGDAVAFPDGLRSARSGSATTVWDLLAAYRGYLLQVAADRLDPALRAKANPSDLVHETLLEAYRDFAQFRGQSEGEWLSWLRRQLVHNLANFERRYFGTAMRQAQREVSLAAGGAAAVAAPGPSPSSVVMAGERGRAIEQNLGRLPDDYRLVILWHHRDGLPFDEIGRRLGRSADAARRLWSRAIERLQELVIGHERRD
jgi:RNA polymerase sigma-70 factor, ECF subfamily